MSTGYTTLPPIFTQHRPAGSLSISHTARTRAAASHSAGTSGGSHTARGSSDRRGLKPPLPEFRKKKDLSSGGGGGGVGGGRGARDDVAAARDSQNGATLIASNRKVATSSSSGSGSDGKRGRLGGPGGGAANHHHLVGVSSSNGLGGGGLGRSSSDEATISSDGTVTFGPNLSLLMSSLAVRFDEAGEWDDAIMGGGGGGGGGGRARRGLGEDGDHVSHSLALLSSRKRAQAKQKEWSQMNALYSKAMEDKTTTKEQSQWFLARFNYASNHHPIIHTPAPGTGAGLIPPQGMRQAVQQQSGYAPPSAEHAHLLHSASGSYLANHHHSAAADQATSAAVRVEEEPEEDLEEL